MAYNEKCEECKSTGNEYLIDGYYCTRCASDKINQLENKNRFLVNALEYIADEYECCPCGASEEAKKSVTEYKEKKEKKKKSDG